MNASTGRKIPTPIVLRNAITIKNSMIRDAGRMALSALGADGVISGVLIHCSFQRRGLYSSLQSAGGSKQYEGSHTKTTMRFSNGGAALPTAIRLRMFDLK